MRRPIFLAAIVVLAALPAVAATPERAAEIRKTTDAVLRAEAGPNGGVQKALAHLVSLAGSVAKDAKLPGPARAKLDAAVEKTTNAGPMDPASVAAISEAYAALNGERAFTFPPDVKSIDGAKALFRRLSERSVRALEAGRAGEAARDLLGCVLAVITPMEAGP